MISKMWRKGEKRGVPLMGEKEINKKRGRRGRECGGEEKKGLEGRRKRKRRGDLEIRDWVVSASTLVLSQPE